MSIPAFILDEHHEAFAVWHQAVQQGYLPSCGIPLLHVDEHSDMSLPHLRRSLPAFSSDLYKVLQFTYNELDIGNFIWPAVYQGLFSKVCWVRQKHLNPLWRSMKICAKDASACEFITGSTLAKTPYEHAPDQKTMEYELLTTADPFPQWQSWTLDIDLDYFCCNSFTDVRNQAIEITEQQYLELSTDVYHFLRISPGSKISWQQLGSRYFIRFNDFPNSAGPTFDPEQIRPRLDSLIVWLSMAQSCPVLITISRSVHSGYTPVSEVDNIQEFLLKGLNQLWPIDQKSLTVSSDRQLEGACK